MDPNSKFQRKIDAILCPKDDEGNYTRNSNMCHFTHMTWHKISEYVDKAKGGTGEYDRKRYEAHKSFYSDDLTRNAQLTDNQWYYIAYVIASPSLLQSLYINDILDKNSTSNYRYYSIPIGYVIGVIPLFTWSTFLNDYIDKLTFVSRNKNKSELLDKVTLVTHYSFDDLYFDSGPNQIINSTGISTSFYANGRLNQILLINSTPSYFQTTDFYFLGQTNCSFITNSTILPVRFR
ncbi:unnamed protein product [Adineta ricciae]|uniref:Uncharacterized protein n=1 Tax=Adineta ricciae TaxID=249248 RepID=A0A814M7I5_ADIRI|nr:unnamed protein product [Adineta ricciae]CAF1080064.1 unnamed protein product [Adineta ricciae]